MKHRKNERRERKRRRVEKGRKGWRGEGKEGGGNGERKFFPCIGPWMLRTSMQVLIKRIQKRGASSFVWRCGRGSFGGVNLTPPHPRVPCGASALFPRFTTEPPSCTCVPQHQEKPSGQSEEEDWEALNSFFFTSLPYTSLPYIHVSPNPPGCLWQGKWSTLFIHLLGSQTKASHCE